MKFDPRRVLFYASRHGQTGLNEDDRLRGPMNAPLDAKGHQDGQELAKFVDPLPIAAIATSPLLRALETAMHVGDAKGLTPYIEPKLASWNIGAVAGAKEDSHAEALIEHYVNHPDQRIPGGESLNEFRQRVHPIFGMALKARQLHKMPSLMSVHDSVIREMGNVFNKDMESALVKPGGLVAVMHQRDGSVRAVPVFRPDKQNRKTQDEE